MTTKTGGSAHGQNSSSSESSSESYSGSSSSFDRDNSWIEWVCGQKGGAFYVEVDENYVQDDFNLTGLRKYFEYYDEALNVILDSVDEDEYPEIIDYEAMQLYGLIHARFLLTTSGQTLFKEKVNSGVYGFCPNHYCDLRKQPLLPWGEDLPKKQNTFVFCPACNELYQPRSPRLANIDGAHFGSTAAVAIVSMVFPDIQTTGVGGLAPVYEPKLFGFRLHVPAEERAALQVALALKTAENSVLIPSNSLEPDSDSD